MPVYSYYLGDYLAYIFEYAINVDTGGYTVDWGIGTNTTHDEFGFVAKVLGFRSSTRDNSG